MRKYFKALSYPLTIAICIFLIFAATACIPLPENCNVDNIEQLSRLFGRNYIYPVRADAASVSVSNSERVFSYSKDGGKLRAAKIEYRLMNADIVTCVTIDKASGGYVYCGEDYDNAQYTVNGETLTAREKTVIGAYGYYAVEFNYSGAHYLIFTPLSAGIGGAETIKISVNELITGFKRY